MKKHAIAVTALLMALNFSMGIYGQTNIKPGYIITLKSDTVFGEIDSRGPIKNAVSCSFMKNRGSAAESYKPEDIKAYRFIDGKYYVSHDIADRIEGVKKVFLEFLLHGVVDLYYYKTFEKERYYIQKLGGPFLELSNDEITRKIIYGEGQGSYHVSSAKELENGDVSGEYITHSRKYLGILNATFADCKNIEPSVNGTDFNPRALIRITRKYHEYTCDSFKCIEFEKKTLLKVRIAPAIRMDFSALRFAYDPHIIDTKTLQSLAFLHDLKQPQYFNYGVGVIVNVQPVFFSDKFSFQMESYLTKNSYNDYGDQTVGFFTYHHIVTSTNIASENIITFQYTYPKGNWRPDAFIGIDTYTAFASQVKRTQEDLSTHAVTTYNDVPVSDFFFGFSCGAGINYYMKNGKVPFIDNKFEKLYGQISGQVPDYQIVAVSMNVGVYF